MKAGIKLDKKQLKAVKYGTGPLLIIAGAGTGKTTVITERIKHLVLKKKVEPSKILALTFTEKAAKEMEERVDQAMPYGYTQMWISTFHSFCDRILRNESIHIGLNPSYKLMTEAESILFLREHLFQFDLNYFRPLGNPNKFLEALLQHFSRLKDEDVSLSDYLKFVRADKELRMNKEEYQKYLELANAYKAYEELKTKEGVMDFSDLISNTLKLFRLRKNILKNYQSQFEDILVDEFQDTNYAQNELAILLSGDKKNITVVGDDDQSIYRFRGSSISNIIQFRQRFPKVKIVTLINNYRSTKEILDSSYKLIQNNNPDRLEVKEKLNKKLISVRKIKGEKISFLYRKRVEDEAQAVVKQIEKLSEDKKYAFKDFAILVRANDHAESFVRALERSRIPYQFLGPGRLFHQEEIKDLIAYLKVLYNFEDSASLYRVLNMPVFELDSVEIAALINLSKRKNYSLFEALEKHNEILFKDKTNEAIDNFYKMLKRHLGLVHKETAGQILYYFLEDSGLIQNIVEYKTLKDETIAKNIAKFFDKLKTYETDHQTASVFDVVDWIDLSMQMGESPLAADLDWSENNAVNILTIHSSKGLEFPVVFLVNLVTQRFPTRERHEKIPIPQKLIKEILPSGDFHLEEERRLFYVGLTRARDLLFLTAANFYGEGKRERKLSPFVYETLREKDIEKILRKSEPEDIQLSLLEWADKGKQKEKAILKSATAINYLSYSQLQTFEICPLHYKLKYILKIPTPQTSAQSFGTSVHAALRNFYQNWQNGKKLKIADIKKIIVDVWINEGYSSKTHEKKALEKATKIVANYLVHNFDRKHLPLALEYPFNFYLDKVKIAGRIDRIDNVDKNKIEIIDYKTGDNVLTQKKLEEDLQLTFYALAANEVKDKTLGKEPEDILLSLYYLEKDLKLTTTRSKEQLKEAKELILEKVKEIEKSDFKCSGSLFCKNCEYKILCHA
ncbi:MAG TPA: ATP-dependent DNA helicase [Patescibacteria group bacterium]|jgi:DNA helicase-2/ATP-dependent DNA helicase PcrA|nr:ATP-dependent DNA helicase [Patescibacteria group bacterium]